MVAECGKYGMLFQHAVDFTVQYVICSRVFQLQIFMGRSPVSVSHDNVCKYLFIETRFSIRNCYNINQCIEYLQFIFIYGMSCHQLQ